MNPVKQWCLENTFTDETQITAKTAQSVPVLVSQTEEEEKTR